MVLNASLLKTQHYKVGMKGNMDQSWESSSAYPLHLGVVSIEKGTFGSPSTTVDKFIYIYIYIYIYMRVCVCACACYFTRPGLSTQTKELTVVTHVMQISSNKLSTPVFISVKCKQMEKFNTYTLNSLTYWWLWGYVIRRM